MNVKTLTQTEIERDWQWLFESVTSCMDKLAWMLVQNDVTVPCIPKRVAGRLVPYSFCGQIMLLLDYVKDQRPISRTLVEENTQLFYQIMTLNVATCMQITDDMDDDDDEISANLQQIKDEKYAQILDFIAKHAEHPIATIILAANAKSKITKNIWISGPEMMALLGIDPDSAQQLGIESQLRNDRILFNPFDIQKKLQPNEDLDE